MFPKIKRSRWSALLVFPTNVLIAAMLASEEICELSKSYEDSLPLISDSLVDLLLNDWTDLSSGWMMPLLVFFLR